MYEFGPLSLLPRPGRQWAAVIGRHAQGHPASSADVAGRHRDWIDGPSQGDDCGYPWHLHARRVADLPLLEDMARPVALWPEPGERDQVESLGWPEEGGACRRHGIVRSHITLTTAPGGDGAN